MIPRLGFAHLAWPRTADVLGCAGPDASGMRALNGFALRPEGDWLALVDRSPAPDDPPDGGLGAPGLWRLVQDGATRERVHDLPSLRGVEGLCAAGGSSSDAGLGLCIDWAAATHAGRRDPDWTPLPRDEIETWFDPGHLSLRAGSMFAKGELMHGPGRLALVFRDLASVPEDLSPARRAWLDGLLLDAQRRWRLVRFGIDAPTGCVRAEVDLSGVPAVWARAFVQLSLEALCVAVEWVLAPLSFLVDTGAASRALERHPFHSLNRSPSK